MIAASSPHARRRWRRLLLVAALSCFALLTAFAVAIRTLPGAGPAVANGLRHVIGVDAVTWLEERVAGLEDAGKRAVAPRTPRSLSDVETPQALDSAPTRAPPASSPSPGDLQPRDVQPPFPKVAAPGDGRFSPVQDPTRYENTPLMYRTMLHPDPARPWAELFIVTVPVPRIDLWAVAGTLEPASRRELRRWRTGLIRPEHEPSLLAAFNGGFRAEHGQHGMKVDGIEFLPPRTGLCTVWADADGALGIGTWTKDSHRARAEARWWRQTSPCMVEGGRMHRGLMDESTKRWGATLEGGAVIRRSAIGLSADGRRLFVGISNDTTARAMALGMQRAGASDVAQLDVNWSYPKILLFPRDTAGKRHAVGLFRGFLFDDDDYVSEPSPRDFFYLVRRE